MRKAAAGMSKHTSNTARGGGGGLEKRFPAALGAGLVLKSYISSEYLLRTSTLISTHERMFLLLRCCCPAGTSSGLQVPSEHPGCLSPTARCFHCKQSGAEAPLSPEVGGDSGSAALQMLHSQLSTRPQELPHEPQNHWARMRPEPRGSVMGRLEYKHFG